MDARGRSEAPFAEPIAWRYVHCLFWFQVARCLLRGKSPPDQGGAGSADKRLATSSAIGDGPRMPSNRIIASCRIGTWCCIVLLAVLSLVPADEMVRTGLPGGFEHFVAYFGSAAFAVAGYGRSRGSMQIIGSFWVYAALLEYLQRFSPGRHSSIEDFAISAVGALCGGLAVTLFWRRVVKADGSWPAPFGRPELRDK
jgi:VanZ family protein